MRAACLIVCLMTAIAQARPAWAIPYAKLMQAQSVFDAIPPARRDKLTLVVKVKHRDAADTAPVHLWVESGGKRFDVPVAADGTLGAQINPAWMAADVDVATDQPKGSMALDIDVRIIAPPVNVIPVAYLREAVTQAQDVFNTGARAMGGMLAVLAAPGVHGVAIKLGRCCTETATLHGGAAPLTFPQDKDGMIVVRNANFADAPDGMLMLTAPVSWIAAYTD